MNLHSHLQPSPAQPTFHLQAVVGEPLVVVHPDQMLSEVYIETVPSPCMIVGRIFRVFVFEFICS